MNTTTELNYDRVRSAALAMARRLRLDRDEALSEAHEVAAKTLRRWQPSDGSLSRFVGRAIYFRLRASAYEQRRRRNRSRPLPLPPEAESLPEPRRFDLERILDEVSPRAGAVVRRALAEGENGRQPTPWGRKKRKAFARRLCAEAGWTFSEVINSFREIKEALFDE